MRETLHAFQDTKRTIAAMAHPALPIFVGRSAVLGLASALATTLLALATVVGTLPEDPIAAFERRLPPWLLVSELGAAISIVAAALVTSLTRPRVSVGLLIMAVGTLVPV